MKAVPIMVRGSVELAAGALTVPLCYGVGGARSTWSG
jgi:hypothetical protein